jgi:hypothetical protein
MSNDRRRQRSVRILAASIMLAASAVFVAVAVATASRGVLVTASVTAVVVGMAAARMIADEVLTTRRAWFKDRAEQAQAYRDVTVDRTRENMEFIEAVNETLSITTRRITELNGTLRLAEARADESESRRAKLQREIESLRSEVDEPAPSTMTLWDGADVPTIVDLLSWEATAAARAQAAEEASETVAEDADSEDAAAETLPEAKEA